MDGIHRIGLSRRNLFATAGGWAALRLAGGLPLLAAAAAKAAEPAAREVPARILPVPGDLSSLMRQVVGAPLPAGWNSVPADAEGWRALAASTARGPHPILAEIRERLRVSVEPATLGGVPVFVSTPDDMPERQRRRVLLHLHGGGYVLFPGEIGAGEGMMMAGYARMRVVSVDYRMAPDFPFPAALDDALAVWRALLAQADPSRMAVFGTSAGGGLTLSLLMRARDEGTALPAAAAAGSPWADLAGRGDSTATNALVDNAVVSMDGWLGGAARLYAGREALDHPLVSPLYGRFEGLPPVILTSGTRDLLLSDTVRVHRRLRQAGVEAALQVFEAQSHAQFLTPFAPETQEAFAEISGFLDRRLAP
ncbi:alpha/beta hydrolase [Alsobacter sp. R-9]